MTDTQRALLGGWLDAINYFPFGDPRVDDLKESVINLFESANTPMQGGTTDFWRQYLSRCRAALDVSDNERKRRLIKDFSFVAYCLEAGKGSCIRKRCLRAFSVMITLVNHVKGGDTDAS